MNKKEMEEKHKSLILRGYTRLSSKPEFDLTDAYARFNGKLIVEICELREKTMIYLSRGELDRLKGMEYQDGKGD